MFEEIGSTWEECYKQKVTNSFEELRKCVPSRPSDGIGFERGDRRSQEKVNFLDHVIFTVDPRRHTPHSTVSTQSKFPHPTKQLPKKPLSRKMKHSKCLQKLFRATFGVDQKCQYLSDIYESYHFFAIYDVYDI